MKNLETHKVDRKALSEFAQSIGISNEIVCMSMIHSGNVSLVENLDKLHIPDTDGLITNKKHVPLAILAADCLPLLFFDPKKEVIAVAHAGYKGLLNHIIEHTIKRFVSDFKSEPKDILVCIGPGIEMMCYEVSEERIAEFDKAFPDYENICSQIGGRFFLNLREVALQCLLKEGILRGHIEVMDTCTKCDSDFYSYRRGDRDERFVSVISLV